ncbi:hypothetical protein ABW21_db0204749 [Orbilia brochopaga]|nr:hypothetical protein ABW21_db0204749 [Drechslerella brochopaga]
MSYDEGHSKADIEQPAPANRGPFAASTREKPRDLAPGLRPRPHPEVPKAMIGFGDGPPPPPAPPPPPPPPPPPKITIKRGPKTDDGPQTPKKPIGRTVGDMQGDMMDELKKRIAGRATPQAKTPFVEPVRNMVKTTPPSLADKIAAELPSGKAKLKPVGSKAGDWLRREQEAQKEREDSLKKEIRPPRTPITPKQPPFPPFPPKTEVRPVKPPELTKPALPKTFRPVRTPKPPEPIPVEPVLMQENVEIPAPEELNLDISQGRAVTTKISNQRYEKDDEGEGTDPYLVWAIRIVGIILIVSSLLKIELYLWVISMATTLGLEDLL